MTPRDSKFIFGGYLTFESTFKAFKSEMQIASFKRLITQFCNFLVHSDSAREIFWTTVFETIAERLT